MSTRLRTVAIASIGVSVLASVVGFFVLPGDADVVRHSSGSTWSKPVALVAFPAITIALSLLGAVFGRGADRVGAVIAVAVAVAIAAWQVVAIAAAA